MQCRICQAQLTGESQVCPFCQAPIHPPTAAVEQFAEPAPFREYADTTISYRQQPIATPTHPPIAMPVHNGTVGGLTPIAPTKPRHQGRAGLILAFVLVIIVSMSAGSLLTYFFMPHGQVTQTPSSHTSQKQLDYGTADPQTIYTNVTSKTPTRVDPLNDASTSFLGSTATCYFKNGAYHVIESKSRYFHYCTSEMIYNDFAFQVEVNILQGYAGGITFRGSGPTHTYYIWRVDTTGAYRLTAYNGSGTSPVLLESAHIPYFKNGYNQKNLLTVIAHNSDILLYVNQRNIGRLKDTSFTSGAVGLLSYNGDATTEISFTNAQTWVLS